MLGTSRDLHFFSLPVAPLKPAPDQSRTCARLHERVAALPPGSQAEAARRRRPSDTPKTLRKLVYNYDS